MKKTLLLRKAMLLGTTALILLFVNFNIFKKEKILANGQTMLLRIRAFHSRSFMQGEYLALRYALAGKVPKDQLDNKGRIVVSLDKNRVAKFIRVHKGEKLQQGEYLLFYRKRRGLKLGAESFLFQEG